MIWWDPRGTGPDEVGNDGEGLWRYARRGARYLPDDWPDGDVGLHDDATSVTILEQLPPGAAPAGLPVTCVSRALTCVNRAVTGVDPALTVDVATDDARRVADRDASIRQVVGHDGARADDHVTADRHTRQHDGAVPEPRRRRRSTPAGRRRTAGSAGRRDPRSRGSRR